MKKFIFVLCTAGLSISITAQTWKTRIETKTVRGNYITKTLVIKPGQKITVRKIVSLTDGSSLPYRGTFLGGSSDSIRINLNPPNPLQQPKNKNDESFPGIKDFHINSLSIALSDVSYIDYCRLSEKTEGLVTAGTMLGILGSLAALTITPLFCINFKDKKFNGDRYKKWAIGGAVGLVSSFTILITAIKIDDNKYHFKLDVPGKEIKVWNFKP